jgi:hypothetical protein
MAKVHRKLSIFGQDPTLRSDLRNALEGQSIAFSLKAGNQSPLERIF